MDTLYLVMMRVPDGQGDAGTSLREKYVRAVSEAGAIAAAQDEDTLEVPSVWPICTGPLRATGGHPRRRYSTEAVDRIRAARPYLADLSRANSEMQAAVDRIEAL